MKILVVYYSYQGNTKNIVDMINIKNHLEYRQKS